jgi:hypothetical protein
MSPAYLDPDDILASRRVEFTCGDRHNQDRYAALSEPARKRQRRQLIAADAVELGRDKADAPKRLPQSSSVPTHDGRHFLQKSSRASMVQMT